MIHAHGFRYDPTKPVDMHVHIVGDGSAGSGCVLKGGATFLHRALYRFMEGHIGLPAGSMNGNLDKAFEKCLARSVERSSLGGAAILAQDWVYREDGKRMKSRGTFHVPNDHVFDVCSRHPGLLPVASIHPARPDAMDELERCLDLGAVMLKLLPNCNNVDCNLPRYRKFWQRMADAGLPFLAHTGGENTLDIIRPELQDPAVVRLPLECGVKVVAAHCAGKSAPGDREYFDKLLKMMRRHQNLYADQSALLVPLRSRLFHRLHEEPIRDRLVHGSDFPVPVFGIWAWMRGLIDWRTMRRWGREPNVIERDYRLKVAIGLPNEVFMRGWSILRLPGHGGN